ncbi:hypothetical protein L1987_06330 [Smallanthus sonchifolius]|uniref:Uncharacterized protein n=1 Tax=Smallanthus sonchifolius TaxID=185202 RepID=A0ACB9JY16_9ASTR|nr:hypothetical protein L1987_06330 [Smallanthus sonchifolius]
MSGRPAEAEDERQADILCLSPQIVDDVVEETATPLPPAAFAKLHGGSAVHDSSVTRHPHLSVHLRQLVR